MVQYLGVGVVVTYWVGVVVDSVGVVVDSVGVGVVVDSVGVVVDGVVETRSMWKKRGKRCFSDCLPNKLACPHLQKNKYKKITSPT